MALLVVGLYAIQYIRDSRKQRQASNSSVTTPYTSQEKIYGIAMGRTLSRSNPTQRAEILARIKKAGFMEVRVTLNWTNAEPTQGSINWSTNDGLVKAVKKAGLRPILLIDRTPDWARNPECAEDSACPPADPTTYASFVGKAAERYKSYDINAWEIWNEENSNNFWKPNPDATAYANLLKASYKAIKESDPDAVVLVGGLSGDSVDKLGKKMADPRTFLKQLYEEGAKGSFDGVAYHPYIAGGGLPTKVSDYNGWSKMANESTSIRSIMEANGDASKQIWITEFGVPTGGTGPEITDLSSAPAKADHVSYDVQSQIVEAILADMARKDWIRNFDWYTYRDGPDAPTNKGSAFGLWKANGESKPFYKLLRNAMNE